MVKGSPYRHKIPLPFEFLRCICGFGSNQLNGSYSLDGREDWMAIPSVTTKVASHLNGITGVQEHSTKKPCVSLRPRLLVENRKLARFKSEES